MMSHISIVIPIYNTGRALIHCLDSIRKQTFLDYEVVMIDDGSTDDTGAICDQYAEKDARFVVYHYANAGVATARNRGIALARGQWVTFIDSDDWVDEHYLQGMVDCLNAQPNASAVVNTRARVNESTPMEWGKTNQALLSSQDQVIRALAREHMPSSMWCYMFKKELLRDARVDPALHYFEDLDFLLQFFRTPIHCAINLQGGYHYRQGSVTHRKLTPKTLTAFDMVDKQIKNGFAEDFCRYLDGKMILDVAMVCTKDPEWHPELAKVLQMRAKAFCRKKAPRMHSKKIILYIKLVAWSPKLFYLLQRSKNKMKHT